jgi:hypothetical protein
MRALLVYAALLLISAACTEVRLTPADTFWPAATPYVTLPPTPTPGIRYPSSYATPTSRAWAQLVKAPDSYIGNGYKVWGCITQFDAETGVTSFRAVASYRKETDWHPSANNAVFTGTAAQLTDFLADDLIYMSVIGLGSSSYYTPARGWTPVLLFQVVTIARKGSCK